MGVLKEGSRDHFTISATPSAGCLTVAGKEGGTDLPLSVLEQVIPVDTVHDKLVDDLEQARNIQRGLLPAELPDNRKITIRAFCSSAQPVGGDLVDVFYMDKKRLGLLIADACGSGLSAALLIAQVHAVIRNESRHSDRPAVIINRLCRQMEETLPRNKFITLFFAVYDIERHLLTCVNSGHPLPLLYGRSEHHRTLSHINPALGVIRGHRYRSVAEELSPGDVLLLYSDGISEAMNREKKEYGDGRIRRILAATYQDPQQLINALNRDVETFTNKQAAEDDRSILVLKINR